MRMPDQMTIKISFNNTNTAKPNVTVAIEIDSEVIQEVQDIQDPIILDYSCV